MPSEECQWQRDAMAARRALNVENDFMQWIVGGRAELRGLSGTEREVETINIVWMKACMAKGATFHDMTVAKGLTCDVSQAIARTRPKFDALLTNCSSTRMYSYEHDRVLLAADWLGILGFPQDYLDFAAEEIARDLVAEAIATPEMGLVLLSLLCVLEAPGLFQSRHAAS